MNCSKTEQTIKYLCGDFEDEEQTEFERHLLSCDECRQTVEYIQRESGGLYPQVSDDILQQAINSLDPNQRDLFIMKEELGLPFAEIAQITDCLEGDVKNRIYYALRKINYPEDNRQRKCKEYSEGQVVDYLYGDIKTHERTEFEHHFKSCRECSREIEDYQLMRQLFKPLSEQKCPATLKADILRKIPRPLPHKKGWKEKLAEFLDSVFRPLAVVPKAVATGFAVMVIFYFSIAHGETIMKIFRSLYAKAVVTIETIYRHQTTSVPPQMSVPETPPTGIQPESHNKNEENASTPHSRPMTEGSMQTASIEQELGGLPKKEYKSISDQEPYDLSRPSAEKPLTENFPKHEQIKEIKYLPKQELEIHKPKSLPNTVITTELGVSDIANELSKKKEIARHQTKKPAYIVMPDNYAHSPKEFKQVAFKTKSKMTYKKDMTAVNDVGDIIEREEDPVISKKLSPHSDVLGKNLNPPLIIAIYNNRIAEVKKLLEKGVDPNAKDNKGMPGLVFAAFRGNSDIVKTLLEYGCEVDAVNERNGRTALMDASGGGHYDIVKMLLDKGADVNAKDKLDADTSLGLAASNGFTKISEALIKSGAEINTKNYYGLTALMKAAKYGNPETVRVLVKNGANVKDKSNKKKTALIMAWSKGHERIVSLLKNSGDLSLDLLKMTVKGDIDSIQDILNYGVDVNIKFNNGGTALIAAVEIGHQDVVELLIQNGAEINEKDDFGYSALISAAKANSTGIVKSLVSLKANVNLADNKGETPLMWAARNKNTLILKLLLKNFAEVNAQSLNGLTALSSAEENGSANIVRVLKKWGAVIPDISTTADLTPKKTNEQTKRWALIIGISSYQDGNLPPLKYAAADAQAFFKWITSPNGGNYHPSRVKLLLDNKATKKNIEISLSGWLGQANKEDIVTIFIAGHGQEGYISTNSASASQLFLLPFDTSYSEIEKTGFSMDAIKLPFTKKYIKARGLIFIADVCYSRKVKKDYATGSGRINKLIKAPLEDLDKLPDLFSSSIINVYEYKQISQWIGDQGVFTHFFLKGLNGQANNEPVTRSMFGDNKLFLKLLEEKIIIKTAGDPDRVHFNDAIIDEDLLRKLLKLREDIEIEPVLTVWRQSNLVTHHEIFRYLLKKVTIETKSMQTPVEVNKDNQFISIGAARETKPLPSPDNMSKN